MEGDDDIFLMGFIDWAPMGRAIVWAPMYMIEQKLVSNEQIYSSNIYIQIVLCNRETHLD